MIEFAAASLLKLVGAVGLLFIVQTAAWAEELGEETDAEPAVCARVLAGGFQLDFTATSPDVRNEVLNQEWSIREMWESGENNFVYRYPTNVMSAAQTELAIIMSFGKKRKKIRGTNQYVDHYPVFSDGVPEAKGFRVVGNEKPLSAYVNLVRALAEGSASGKSVPTFEGPPGTGKTEFMNVLRAVYPSVTGALDHRLAMHTFEFRNIHLVPSLRPFVDVKAVDGQETSSFRAELDHAPFTLLPTEIQDQLIEQSQDIVGELLDGISAPRPQREPDQKSQWILDELYSHYRAQKGAPLTLKERLDILADHVVIRRLIMSSKNGKLPTLEKQGADLDLASLFMRKDPVISSDSRYGSSHPMAWILSGKIPKGNRGPVLFDEFFRNKDEFIELMLAFFESHVVDIAGAPRTMLDVANVVGTNRESIDQYTQAQKTKGAKGTEAPLAILDRSSEISTIYSRRPHQILEALMYMNRDTVVTMKELLRSEALALPKALDLQELFPQSELEGPVLGPDGRYMLTMKGVFISPHALLFLAEIVAATRIKTDITNYEPQLGTLGIVQDPVFRDVLQRIRFNEGLVKLQSLGQVEELDEAVRVIREGHTGMSTRNAGRWLEEALKAARAPEHHNTLTADLVYRVFLDMLKGGGEVAFQVVPDNSATRVKWKALAKRVIRGLLIPRLRSDILKAQAARNSNVDTAYEAVLRELRALFIDGSAKTYMTDSGSEKKIDFVRLQKVKDYYAALTGRPLDPGHILVGLADGTRETVNNLRHPGLYEAVTRHYATIEEQRVSVSDLRQAADDPSTVGDFVRETYGGFRENMLALGYNDYSIQQALEVITSEEDN